MVDEDSTVADLLDEGQRIWDGRPRMTLREIAVAAAVVVGDLARAARDGCDLADVERELGNLIFSSIRWAGGDLRLDLSACLAAAVDAQRAFVARTEADR
jgi:hypothetical protein